MKILYFGDFDPDYARNRVIIHGLEENGVEVLLCRTVKKGFKGLVDLSGKHRGLKNKYDIIIVGYSDSRFMVPLAKLMSNKKIVWDAFYSLYDSWVFDRKLVGPRSLKAKYYWFLDWLGCKLADFILLDTNAHLGYFVNTFNVPKEKFARVLIGADDEIFHP